MGSGQYIRSACKGQPRELIEKWAAGHAASVYLGDHTVLCRVLRNFLMYVDSRDISVSPHLMMRGLWEPWVTMAIARHLKPGMRCIDVGANVGYYTLLMAELTRGETQDEEDGLVLAVEPSSRAAELLRMSLSVNGLQDVVNVAELAASDRQERGTLTHPALLHGGARVCSSATGDVTCVPLDDVAEGQWDFVKVDVEGMEREVIRGLRETLERQEHVTIAVEVTPFEWLPDSPDGFLEAMRLQGFSVGVIEPDGSIADLQPGRLPNQKGKWEMLWLSR